MAAIASTAKTAVEISLLRSELLVEGFVPLYNWSALAVRVLAGVSLIREV
jgi:hypothetical protein